MGNTPIELDTRIREVERLLENYKSTIEPKSGQFVGQHWYDESTEVLNMWTGKEYSPAYGKSIVTDIEGNKTLIQQNTTDITLRVEKTSILAEINLSTEGVSITGDRIEINGFTTFSAGYDPSDKIATGGGANDINTNITTINGGKITANSLTASQVNVDNLFAETITATGSITGAVLRTAVSGNRAEMFDGFTIYDATNKTIEMTPVLGGSISFFDSGSNIMRMTPLLDTTTYGNTVTGVEFNNDIITGDIMIRPTKDIFFLEAGATSSRLYSDGTNLFYRDKFGTTTTVA